MLTSKETAYSHGLEKIYNFEVVDPSTVRKLSVPVSSSQPVGEKPTKVPDNQEAIFNFGAQFEIKMTSLRLEEPLDSLDLSPFAMKALTSYGFKTIGELLHTLPTIKNLGQGHIEEIRTKTRHFLGGRPFEKMSTVDFLALVRIAFHPVDSKDRYLFLQQFDLTHLFPLKPNELHEIEKWSVEAKEKAMKRAYESSLKEQLLVKIKEIITIFIKPWIHEQLGVARKFELEEKLFMITENPDEKLFYTILQLIETLCTDSPFKQVLVEVSPGFYAKDLFQRDHCREVITAAKSYFYTPSTIYPLKKLTTLLEQTFATLWQGFPEGFIERVLRGVSLFVISRSEKGEILVQLNTEAY